MGSIHKEGETWIVRQRIEGKNKKFRPKASGFPNSRAGARAFLAALETKLNNNSYLEPVKETLGSYSDRWLKTYVRQNTTPRTAENYRVQVEAYIKPKLGHIPMSKLNPSHIEEFYAELECVSGEPMKMSSKAAVHRILNGILNHAVEMEALAKNPIKKRLIPRGVSKRTECFTKEEVLRLLSLLTDHPLLLPVSLSLYTGMRVGEVCGLQGGDVDLERKIINVCRNIECSSEGLREKLPKSGRGRTVEIGDNLVDLLRREKGNQAQRKLQGSLPANAVNVVLTPSTGKLHSPEYMGERWKAFIEKTDLPHHCFHTLRHTHASMLIAAGVHAKVISVRLGHSSIGITMDTYGHLMGGPEGPDTATRFDRAMGE